MLSKCVTSDKKFIGKNRWIHKEKSRHKKFIQMVKIL